MRLQAATFLGLGLALVVVANAQERGDRSPQEIFAFDLEQLRIQFLGLAETIPADRYSWKPDPAARSVSEVFMHVASATYFHMQHQGVKIPRGSFHGESNLEVIGDKPTVVQILTESLNHALENQASSQAELADRVQMSAHLHEHLGQAIAYTRSLGLVPPWAEGQ